MQLRFFKAPSRPPGDSSSQRGNLWEDLGQLHNAGGFAHRVVRPTTFPFVPEDGNAYHRVGSEKKERSPTGLLCLLTMLVAARSKGIIIVFDWVDA